MVKLVSNNQLPVSGGQLTRFAGGRIPAPVAGGTPKVQREDKWFRRTYGCRACLESKTVGKWVDAWR